MDLSLPQPATLAQIPQNVDDSHRILERFPYDFRWFLRKSFQKSREMRISDFDLSYADFLDLLSKQNNLNIFLITKKLMLQTFI